MIDTLLETQKALEILGIPSTLDRIENQPRRFGGGGSVRSVNGVGPGTDGNITITTGTAGAISRVITSVSSPTTAAAATATDYVYLVSGTTTLTLPTALANKNRYSVTNVGSNTVTVATTSGQTINGSSTATLPIANMSLDFISNNSNWVVE